MNILKGHHKAYTEQAIKETLDYISLNDLPEFPSAALVFAPLRSVLNVCHWHTAPSVNDATAEPAPAKRGYRLPLPPCRLKIHAPLYRGYLVRRWQRNGMPCVMMGKESLLKETGVPMKEDHQSRFLTRPQIKETNANMDRTKTGSISHRSRIGVAIIFDSMMLMVNINGTASRKIIPKAVHFLVFPM